LDPRAQTWHIKANDLATVSFSSNFNNLGSQGVGGLVLAEAVTTS
jgi:hypothetical protein